MQADKRGVNDEISKGKDKRRLIFFYSGDIQKKADFVQGR
jgi:hypothetical protein